MSGKTDETDFFAWTQERAAALRKLAESKEELPGIDLEELAEEIEDVGNDIRSEVEGLVIGIVANLLKLRGQATPAEQGRWRLEVDERRTAIAKRARRAWSVLSHLDIDKIHRNALTLVELEGADVPKDAPAPTLDHILDPEWWPPESRRI